MGKKKAEKLRFQEVEADFADESIPAIEYRHVCKEYEEGSGVLAVDDLNLSIADGEFAMLVGSSGGGKTTMMKMVNGLITPTSGQVLVSGHDVQDFDLVDLRRHIGYSIQGSVLFPNMSVGKNIAYVMQLEKHPDKEAVEARVHELIEMVGLDDSMLKKYPDELSGGQQQRVGIARAMANHPRLLLMDEPFGAVDSITRKSLQDEILGIFEKTDVTILFVTHDVNEALKLGTKVAVMDTGVLQQYASPDEMIAHPATPYVERLLEGRN